MTNGMKIVSPLFDNAIELSPDRPFLLIEESPSEFYKTVCGFCDMFAGGESDYSVISGGCRVKAGEYGVIVRDCFGVELNDKRSSAAILKAAERQYLDEEMLPDLNRLNYEIGAFLQKLTYNMPVAVEYNELSVSDLLKAAGLRAEENYESYLEKLVCYVDLVCGLKNTEFIIFVNLKSVLTDEELLMLYKHCACEKVSLLLIESSKIRPLLPCERAIIITDDLCEIVENYGIV